MQRPHQQQRDDWVCAGCPGQCCADSRHTTLHRVLNTMLAPIAVQTRQPVHSSPQSAEEKITLMLSSVTLSPHVDIESMPSFWKICDKYRSEWCCFCTGCMQRHGGCINFHILCGGSVTVAGPAGPAGQSGRVAADTIAFPTSWRRGKHRWTGPSFLPV